MAFSYSGSNHNAFGSPTNAPGADGTLQVREGPELEEIQTEILGFLALGGEAKVKLLPTPWPTTNLPPPTACLMSIASQRGLIAAAGPDAVIVASTESVRKAFQRPKVDDSDIRSFQPQLTIPMPMRISHVAFTADENFLVLSAETGGGLAVYDIQNLLKGSTQSAFEMPTNSTPLRALSPNPTPERGELLAVVTADGKLMMANLSSKAFVSGVNGNILKDGVSCVSWSPKGKQLLAGLGDGSAFQMTPEGVGKGDIPRAPGVEPNCHISSIAWLENNVMLFVTTASTIDESSAPSSVFHIVTRQPPSEFVFQKIADPSPPFGLPRYPPHHFLPRLKDFPPNLQDLIVVASSASTDIGLFCRSKTPLVTDKPADRVAGVFTMAELYDSRRAQLSISTIEDGVDTSPIGVALDLSATEKVIRPIPTDEMDESPTPVPAFMVLNNEGILASWWVIYSESIKQGSIYPGLVAAGGTQLSSHSMPQQASTYGAASNASFGQATFGVPAKPSSAFQPLKSTGLSFASPSTLGTSTSNTFGASSMLNNAPSPWATPVSSNAPSNGLTFGISNFGTAPTPNEQGVVFGSAALPGIRSSPWSKAASGTPAVAFGQPSGLGTSTGSTFSSTPFNSGGTANVPQSGGFASHANKGGFGAIAATQPTKGNIFGSNSGVGGFATPKGDSNGDSGSVFGGGSLQKAETQRGIFGGSGFTLSSTFKPDGSANDDLPKVAGTSGSSFFGNGFGKALGEAEKRIIPISNEADMDDEAPEQTQVTEVKKTAEVQQLYPNRTEAVLSTTPTTTPAASKFYFPSTAAPVSDGILGTSPSSDMLAAKIENKDIPAAVKESPLAKVSSIVEAPRIKEEPQSDDDREVILNSVPEAPLPPDPTSKVSYLIGESSTSSIEPDAPLPPDFIPTTTNLKQTGSATDKNDGALSGELIPPSYVPGGPGDGDESDFRTEDNENDSEEGGSEEGSGEDVAKDSSPASESHQTPGFTPQSSFGASAIRGTGDGLFTNVSRPSGNLGSRSLFGEIDGRTIPPLPPPKTLSSPRSPSPIRNPVPGRIQRQDMSRSVSAPGVASQLLGPRSTSSRHPSIASNTTLISMAEQKKAEERRKTEIASRKEAEEARALVDEEDESIQRFLREEIEGTKVLDDFIAHQDYVGKAETDTIPAQVEAVYRDINSMIDTLGLNSRSLRSFIKGHEEQYSIQDRKRKDLGNEENWCLDELRSLRSIIVDDMTSKLDKGQLEDVQTKLEACLGLEKDLGKLRAKHDDIKTFFTSYQHRDQISKARSLPLTAEQAAQQHDLRRDFTKSQQLLGEVEESLVLLRTRLAARGGMHNNVAPGPTVEAVMRTVMKMTSMAEKRSGDVDVLENSMRNLRLGASTTNRSREASPFATPASKTSVRNPGTSSTYSLFYTPNSNKDVQLGFHSSVTSSANGRASPYRKKLSGFTEEDKRHLRANMMRRKAITDRLKAALEQSGVRIQDMDRD